MLRSNGVAFVDQGDSGIVDPGAEDGIQRKLAAPEVIGDILLLHRMCSLVCDLVCLIAVVNLRDIPLFGNFDSLLVGKLREAPEQHAVAGGAAMKKTVRTPTPLAFRAPRGGLGPQA